VRKSNLIVKFMSWMKLSVQNHRKNLTYTGNYILSRVILFVRILI